MSEQRDPARFELLMERDAEPIEGVLVAECAQWQFSGWTGLAVALEHALSAAATDGSRRQA